MDDAEDMDRLTSRIDFLLSICPPHAATVTAELAAEAGYRGLYVDANAISPATAHTVSEIIARAGGTFVDGGIIGLPPGEADPPHVYLSGREAPAVAALFSGTPVSAPVLTEDPFAASALKMSHAAWTKGSAGLLLAIDSAARRAGVRAALHREWTLTRPDVKVALDRAQTNAGNKGWRWVGELEEIAATFDELGLPDGFHLAAARIFAEGEL
jgi:3-hydroxyisobutyrate dehydrogenase-like beta-hydroxyacid dehydrogenase